MSNQNPKINNSSFEDRPSRPVRLSFREAFRRAASQVELYTCTDIFERDHLRELCYIIAEVYIIDPDSKVIKTHKYTIKADARTQKNTDIFKIS